MQKKSVFYKIMRILYPYKNALWALRPAKPLGVLSRHPCRNPKPLPRGEGLCMLGWLCIVQSLLAYTPGIRAGGGIGDWRPCDPPWGYAQSKDALIACQKFARCKTNRASNKRHPHFQKTQRFIDRLKHPFEGVSDFFYNLLRAVKISPYFLHFFTFSWTKRASVVYYI